MGAYVAGSCYLGIHEPSHARSRRRGRGLRRPGGHLAVLTDAAEAAAARTVLADECQGAVAWVDLDRRGWVTGEPVTYLGGLKAVPDSGFAAGLNPEGSLSATWSATGITCALCEAPVSGPACEDANECLDGSVCTEDVCTESGCT